MRRFNGVQADPDENVTVVCGSTEGIADAVIALTDPGDRVIIPEPFYENYIPSAILSGAKPAHFRMREPDFRLAEEDIKKAFSARPKAILLNTPNNPTGRVLSTEELRIVADLCEDYNVIAITDEIYEYIVYDGKRHISLASIGDMFHRTVTISGLSKTYSVTGWRHRICRCREDAHQGDKVRARLHDRLRPDPASESWQSGVGTPGLLLSVLGEDL